MRISIVGPTYPFRGGISHHTTLLAKELSKNHQVNFISFSRQYPKILFPGKTDKDPSAKKLFDGDVHYTIDSINPLSLLFTGNQIRKANPELVIIPWWVIFWAPHFLLLAAYVKKFTSAKIYFFCHNVVEHEANFIKVLATKLVLSRADKIFTQSIEETKRVKQLLTTNTAVETTFHPTYVDLNLKKLDQKEAQQQLKIDGPTILFFGFVRPYKGLDVLLKAMPHIVKEQKITLLVVGEFWKDKEKYSSYIKDHSLEKHIRIFDKYIANDDLPCFFAAADLVVQPYKSVTGSGVCQLSYGFDTPVIATNIGSLSEVIENGINGYLVPPNDPEKLADAILKCLRPKELAVLKRNAKQTKHRYSWDRLVKIICRQD